MPFLTNPWLAIALMLAWAGSVAGTAVWQRAEGRELERADWVEKVAKADRKASAERLAWEQERTQLQQEARRKEQHEAQRLQTVSANYQKRLNDAKQQTEIALDAIRSGVISLRIPGPTGKAGGYVVLPGTEPAAGGCHGPAQGELPREAAEFLYAEADRADQITEQLMACQEALKPERAASPSARQ